MVAKRFNNNVTLNNEFYEISIFESKNDFKMTTATRTKIISKTNQIFRYTL